ncbi:hypothetical protein JK182_14025 [Acetobacter okinawensis]|uniref:hypothetical protein n=1 Tax=Acetobacter okinawensis TaxID=1076594 RepID=UPI001BA450BC|nr:hypothetical protein [Acetobacter okinawensis]MBS0989761.1 hypothetical protein [Acetobacter okinawensis]
MVRVRPALWLQKICRILRLLPNVTPVWPGTIGWGRVCMSGLAGSSRAGKRAGLRNAPMAVQCRKIMTI